MDENQKTDTCDTQDSKPSISVINSETEVQSENRSDDTNVAEIQKYTAGINSNEIIQNQDSVKETDVREKSEEKAEPQIPLVRTVKKGRSLIPRKEESKTAPSNFVDCPDYGYVGIDGSYQVPF